jgi:hypothetical protein
LQKSGYEIITGSFRDAVGQTATKPRRRDCAVQKELPTC